MGKGRSVFAPTERSRATVENCACISITELLRHDVFTSEETVTWDQRPDGGLLPRVLARAIGDQAVVIVAQYKNSRGETDAAQAEVWLSWSDCHYGGRRPWLLCPAMKDQAGEDKAGQDKAACGRRVGTLYLSDKGAFTCRQCAGLGYKSDHQLTWERSLHQGQKIIQLLGGTGNLQDDFPERPKGMHYPTWYRLRRRVSLLIEGDEPGGDWPEDWPEEWKTGEPVDWLAAVKEGGAAGPARRGSYGPTCGRLRE